MNTIHPTAIIGTGVRLGDGNIIGAHVVVGGNTVVGDGNWIGANTVLGAPPEIRSHPHPADWIDTVSDAGLVIGSDNVVREGVHIHAGWHSGTTLGSDLFIMNQCYVAHDGIVQDGVTMASSVVLAGHVAIGRGANLGLGTSVHQGRVIGAYGMVGMGSVVTRNLPPFALSFGSPARVHGTNTVGMERAGFSSDEIEWASSGRTTGQSARVAAEVDWFTESSQSG